MLVEVWLDFSPTLLCIFVLIAIHSNDLIKADDIVA